MNHDSDVGAAVVIANDRMDLMKKMMRAENFNVMASNMVSVKRSLHDVRHDECKTIEYPSQLPKASIIIVFHNEVWSMLIRTIWSIVNRTPKELLQEIILVDDLSTRAYLRQELNDYLEPLPVTFKIIRTKIRQGVVRARVQAADVAAVCFSSSSYSSTMNDITFVFRFVSGWRLDIRRFTRGSDWRMDRTVVKSNRWRSFSIGSATNRCHFRKKFGLSHNSSENIRLRLGLGVLRVICRNFSLTLWTNWMNWMSTNL